MSLSRPQQRSMANHRHWLPALTPRTATAAKMWKTQNRTWSLTYVTIINCWINTGTISNLTEVDEEMILIILAANRVSSTGQQCSHGRQMHMEALAQHLWRWSRMTNEGLFDTRGSSGNHQGLDISGWLEIHQILGIRYCPILVITGFFMPIDFMSCNLLSLSRSHSLALIAPQRPSKGSFQTWQPEQDSEDLRKDFLLSLLEQRSPRQTLGTLVWKISPVSAAIVDRQPWYSKHHMCNIYIYIYNLLIYACASVYMNLEGSSKSNYLSLSSSFRRLSKSNCALWQRSWKRCKLP